MLSFRRLEPANRFRLLPPFSGSEEERPDPVDVTYASRWERRPALARLLAALLDLEGRYTPQRICLSQGAWWKGSQFASIRGNAQFVLLDTKVAVMDVLCRFPTEQNLQRLREQLQHRMEHDWSVGARPHGIVIATVKAIRPGVLETHEYGDLAVRGRIAVWGEPDGDDRPPFTTTDDTRPPYLAVALMGQAVPHGPFDLVGAYVHPCASEENLMLIDGAHQRKTLEQLAKLNRSLKRKHRIELTVEKPLFDVGQCEADDGDWDVATAPAGRRADNGSWSRPVLLPDFIVWADKVPPGGCPKVSVETMAYDTPSYRQRKERLRPLMSAALHGAPVVTHDFHGPEGKEQEQLDHDFLKALRQAITGLALTASRTDGVSQSAPKDDGRRPAREAGSGSPRLAVGFPTCLPLRSGGG